ncbi:MAG: 7-cyano-7-deazaguanine synthase [Paludibacteraceae bacterium]|nr:7-cyano-7-deazaguanine synthase [Paludibacteraceae bacterium]
MRCKKCLNDSKYLGAAVNDSGICDLCEDNYPYYKPLGEAALVEFLNAHKKPGTEADCLVGISGGKDSTYCLVKLAELGIKTEAFTYVHSGSSEIPLENAKHVCEKLGIKHHIVSLDGDLHRKLYREFVDAWFYKNSPVMANMACVACKYTNVMAFQLAKKRNIPMIAMASNPYETPPFLGAKRVVKDGKLEVDQKSGAIALAKTLIQNPIGMKTVLSNLKTCYVGCRSLTHRAPYLLNQYKDIATFSIFDYIDWEPEYIKSYIREKVDWYFDEKKEDWHADCMFHSLKDYMFMKTTNGSSYYLSYLSNQIRHGLMTREEGIEKYNAVMRNSKEELLYSLDVLGWEDLKDKIDLSVYDNVCIEE